MGSLPRARTRIWTRVLCFLLSHLSHFPSKSLFFSILTCEEDEFHVTVKILLAFLIWWQQNKGVLLLLFHRFCRLFFLHPGRGVTDVTAKKQYSWVIRARVRGAHEGARMCCEVSKRERGQLVQRLLPFFYSPPPFEHLSSQTICSTIQWKMTGSNLLHYR